MQPPRFGTLDPKQKRKSSRRLFPDLLQNGGGTYISASKRAGWDLVERLLAHGYRSRYRYTIIDNDIQVYMIYIYICINMHVNILIAYESITSCDM